MVSSEGCGDFSGRLARISANGLVLLVFASPEFLGLTTTQQEVGLDAAEKDEDGACDEENPVGQVTTDENKRNSGRKVPERPWV